MKCHNHSLSMTSKETGQQQESGNEHLLTSTSHTSPREAVTMLFETNSKNEPPHDTINKMNAPSEDSDQPRHPPSLIRVFAVRSMSS